MRGRNYLHIIQHVVLGSVPNIDGKHIMFSGIGIVEKENRYEYDYL